MLKSYSNVKIPSNKVEALRCMRNYREWGKSQGPSEKNIKGGALGHTPFILSDT